MNQFEIIAESRPGNGSAVARRLRRQGRVPAVIYGGKSEPKSVSVQLKDLTRQLENEAFFSHILSVNVDGKAEQVVLKALQRHPVNARVIHMDLLRVSQSQALVMHVPLHFSNEETAPGKKAGGVINHHMIEVEISCLPKDLPEFIAIDVGALEIGDALHVRELVLPAGVTLVTHGMDLAESPVVSIQHAQKLDVEPTEEGEEAEGAADGEAAGPGAEDDED